MYNKYFQCYYKKCYFTVAVTAEKDKSEDDYVEVLIGVLTAVMLLLLGIFIVILVLSRRQKLQGSPTTILRNPFGVTVNMKVSVVMKQIHLL